MYVRLGVLRAEQGGGKIETVDCIHVWQGISSSQWNAAHVG